ncbi:CG11790 [Drosophila busckii]|uniref:CG11790 n=1 Tax=Drosophila busckii TaxID=30019 RepID=A0A0M4EA28_DROBS|nr:thioredoxin domain-containing protein [Drosophila busckii]ALC38010.1 CG11790 [Drosophila busckii]
MWTYQLIGAVCLGLLAICSAQIDRVDDSDLIHLLTGQGDVVTLFTKNRCVECEKYEEAVAKAQHELKETLGATVVKAENSNLIHIYDPSLEPALLYFRRGIPILYYGDVNEEEIVHFFNDNREPSVKELSDETFEHLTQASTGATTGDWFVFFYTAECVLCQRLYAVWEAVGGRLKRQMNVARINAQGAGVTTAKRFKIMESQEPALIFLRQGKLYRYQSKDYTPKAFIEFAESGYAKQTHPEAVPPLAGMMDDISLARISEYLRGLDTIPLALMGSLTLVLLLLIVKKCCKAPEKQPKTKKNK